MAVLVAANINSNAIFKSVKFTDFKFEFQNLIPLGI